MPSSAGCRRPDQPHHRQCGAGGQGGPKNAADPPGGAIGGRVGDRGDELERPVRAEVRELGEGHAKCTELGHEIGAAGAGLDVRRQRHVGSRVAVARRQGRETLVVGVMLVRHAYAPDALIR
jgi:hypothetical protein